MRHLSNTAPPRASILIVDTDPESLVAIASILIAQQHHVMTAPDASTALTLSSNETLDLIITDTRLASQSGEELVSQIRLDPDKHDLPVMYVSATQLSGVIRRIHDSGDAFHLQKPIAPEVLIELVDRALWMPHLISSHLKQKTVNPPHVAFAMNPFATPLATPFAAHSYVAHTPSR